MDELVFEKKMKKKGIAVRVTSRFGMTGCIRVTVGTQENNQAFLKALKEIIL